MKKQFLKPLLRLIRDGLLKWQLIEHHYICQSQSINLYLSADIDKWDLMMLHWKAWELGVKESLLL